MLRASQVQNAVLVHQAAVVLQIHARRQVDDLVLVIVVVLVGCVGVVGVLRAGRELAVAREGSASGSCQRALVGGLHGDYQVGAVGDHHVGDLEGIFKI